jgi:AraC-like DNA-binding protein
MEKARHRFPDAVFATSLIEPGMRTIAYRRWLGPIALFEPCNEESVDATIISYRLGQITVAQSTSGAAHYLRDEQTIAKGQFNECMLLRLLTKGRVRGRFGAEEVEIRPGDIYLSDMSQQAELWVEEDCAHINVMFPRAPWEDLPMHGRVLRAEWLPCRMLREHLVNFVEVLRYCNADNLQDMVKVTMELLHFCLRNGDGRGGSHDAFDEARERIVQYIDKHLSESDLGAARLQQAFGVSRAQLYRQFAELGGIQHYIRNKRLQAVLRDLCNEPQRSITEIIERYGFSNERQFQRAFRARFGMTASQVRADWKTRAIAEEYDEVLGE